MRKTRCLAFALLLVFVFTSCALAIEGIAMSLATVRDSGTLEVIGSSGYTDEKDMNFTASTENGELEVKNAVALRDEGTSWFVILEYGSDNQNDKLRAASDEVMKGIANLVLDIDDGALVPCDGKSGIHVQKPQPLRDALNGVHGKTDANEVPTTVRNVMNYIYENRASLMPNVAVVLIAQARTLDDSMMESLQDTFNRFSTITTHVICPVSKNTKDERWKTRAVRLSQMGAGTLSGSGYVMSQDKAEASNAVDNIRDLERSMIMLLLEPKAYDVDFIGKELTLTQTTAGGKNLTTTGKLSDETYGMWKTIIEEKAAAPAPESGGTEKEPEQLSPSLFPTNSGSTFLYVPSEVQYGGSSSNSSTMELIIGIALGVVILALVITLILINRGKKKKSTATTIHGVPAGGSSSSGGGGGAGIKVTLRGDDGSTYTGTMKNNRLVIGRDSRKGAMLAIPTDGKLSSVHVILEKQGHQLMAMDQGSMNGTKVNGNKITGPMIMNQNDTLGIGSHTYTVTWRG